MEFFKNFYILKLDGTREELFQRNKNGGESNLICFSPKRTGFIPEIQFTEEELQNNDVAYEKMASLLFSIEKINSIETIIKYKNLKLTKEICYYDEGSFKAYIYKDKDKNKSFSITFKAKEEEEDIFKNFCEYFDIDINSPEMLKKLNSIKNVMLESNTPNIEVQKLISPIEEKLLKNHDLLFSDIKNLYEKSIEINPILKLSSKKKLFYNFIYDVLLKTGEIKKIQNSFLQSLSAIVETVRTEIENNLESNNTLDERIAKKRIMMATTFLYLKKDDWRELVNTSASAIKIAEVDNLIKRMGPLIKAQRSFFDNFQKKLSKIMSENEIDFYVEGYDFLTNTIEVVHNSSGSLQVLKSAINLNSLSEDLGKLIRKTKEIL